MSGACCGRLRGNCTDSDSLTLRVKDQRRKQRGAIVSVASLCGQVAIPNSAAYIASKHAVMGLAKSATLEFAGKGIRVYVSTTSVEHD